MATVTRTEWVPLVDGAHVHDSIIDGKIILRIADNGETIEIDDADGYGKERLHLEPLNYRLCRLVTVQVPDAASVPSEVARIIRDMAGDWAQTYDEGDEEYEQLQRVLRWLDEQKL